MSTELENKKIKIYIALLCLAVLVSCALKDATSILETIPAASEESDLYEKIETIII